MYIDPRENGCLLWKTGVLNRSGWGTVSPRPLPLIGVIIYSPTHLGVVSLRTDTLLFSIVLVLVSIQTALPYDEGSNQILLAGLGLAALALLSSIVFAMAPDGSGISAGKDTDR